MLLKIFLALAGGWLVFIFWKVACLFWARQVITAQKPGKLFVFMGNQEDAAEGFVRKLMAWRNRLWPRLEVAVVDCGTGDETGKIIRLLARKLEYPVIEGNLFAKQKQERLAGKGEMSCYYDARRQKGKKLLKAPLFFFLKEEMKAKKSIGIINS